MAGGGRSILTGTFSATATTTATRSPSPGPAQPRPRSKPPLPPPPTSEDADDEIIASSAVVGEARLKMEDAAPTTTTTTTTPTAASANDDQEQPPPPPPPKLTSASTSSSTVSLSTTATTAGENCNDAAAGSGDDATDTYPEQSDVRTKDDDQPAGTATAGTVEVEEEGERRMFDESTEDGGCRLILEALSDDDISRLSDDGMPLRHFRAEKGDVEKAIAKIKSTLAWRDEFRVSTIASCFDDDEGDDEDEAEEDSAAAAPGEDGDLAAPFSRRDMREIVARENETGKIYVRGYDRSGRAIMYMRPAKENTRHPEDNVRHLVYNLERAIACTRRKTGGRALEKINIVIDYAGFRLGDAPPPRVSKRTLEILQDHYPERMHVAYVCDPPRVFRAFWAMIRPFLDPTTKEKIVFCRGEAGRDVLARSFVLDDLEPCAGGDAGKCVPFDSGEYLRSTPFDRTFAER